MDLQALAADLGPGPALWIGAAAVAAILGGAIWFWVSRLRGTPRQRFERLKKQIGDDVLTGVILPDGIDGTIQIDMMLLTDRGFLILDVREADGRIFGGNALQEWVVFDGEQRYRFPNPLGPLRERVLAVQRLAPDVPVTGWLLFVGDNEFSGGRPDCAATVDELEREYAEHGAPGSGQTVQAFRTHWERVRSASEPVPAGG